MNLDSNIYEKIDIYLEGKLSGEELIDFENELNITVYHEPKIFTWNDKRFYIGHGDGLGPGDYGYKLIKKVFRNPICKWLFGWLHPDLGIGLANYFSRKSREKTGSGDEHFLGAENEWLIVYSKEILQKEYLMKLLNYLKHNNQIINII